MNPTAPVALSVVIPVYESASIFPTLYRRLVEVLDALVDAWEIVAVVDGSRDDSAAVIAATHGRDPRVKLIEFSRNFGNQMAITAGLRSAVGERVVVMDDDLEDPPELIPALMARADEGYDVVYAVRRSRNISTRRTLAIRLYNRLFRALSDFEMTANVGDFCLMRRPVVDALNAMPEGHRFVRALRAWAGFSQAGVEYDRSPRHAGRSGFTFGGYLGLGLDGLFSFSTAPLRAATALGLLVAAASFLLALVLTLGKLAGMAAAVPGWAVAVAWLSVVLGLQMTMIGVLGQYVGRIYDEVRQRPPYIIARSVGLGSEGDAGSGVE